MQRPAYTESFTPTNWSDVSSSGVEENGSEGVLAGTVEYRIRHFARGKRASKTDPYSGFAGRGRESEQVINRLEGVQRKMRQLIVYKVWLGSQAR
jgi:hypothetical protein